MGPYNYGIDRSEIEIGGDNGYINLLVPELFL